MPGEGNTSTTDFAFDLGGDAAKLTDFSLDFPLPLRFRMPNSSATSLTVGVFDLTGLGGSESPVFIGLTYDTRVFDEPTPGTCPVEAAGGVVDTGFSSFLGVKRMPFEGDFDKGGVASGPFSNVWDLRFGIDIGFGDKEGFETPGELDVESNVLTLRIGTGVCGITGVLTVEPVPGQRSSTEVFFGGSGRILSGVVIGLVPVEDSSSALALTMFCTKPRPWRRLRLGVAPIGGVLSENAGDLLKEIIFGPCSESFGFGSTSRANVGVVMVAGREGETDVIEGEGLRRRFGVETDRVGDLDLDDRSVSVRPGCEMDRNVFRGRSGLASLPIGLGVYECRCELGVEGVERLL